MGIGRHLGMKSACSEKIQSLDSLRNETIPQLHGKVGVCRAQAGHKVVFEGPDCPLGGVSTVDMGWRQLHVHVLRGHKLDQGPRRLIVETL
jgi:hypothetical protein